MRGFRLLAVGVAASLLWPIHAQAQKMIPDTDRRMKGDRTFEMPPDKRKAEFCLKACLHDPFCRAWTFSVVRYSPITCSFGNKRVKQPRKSTCCVSGNV